MSALAIRSPPIQCRVSTSTPATVTMLMRSPVFVWSGHAGLGYRSGHKRGCRPAEASKTCQRTPGSDPRPVLRVRLGAPLPGADHRPHPSPRGFSGGRGAAAAPLGARGRVTADDPTAGWGSADAVLLPGGGDLRRARTARSRPPTRSTTSTTSRTPSTSPSRDGGREGVLLLAVCRGWPVVNVALGGDLEQHMPGPHRHRRPPGRRAAGLGARGVVG